MRPEPTFDPDQIPLSPSGGWKPPTTTGDRLMIGLAAIALVGGALIAISRLLPEGPSETSRATATPAASHPEASPTPRPTPAPKTPKTMTVVDEPLPSRAPEPDQYYGWIRLKVDMAVRSGNVAGAAKVGTLHAGDAASVSQPTASEGGKRGWLRVDAPLIGWLHAAVDDDELVDMPEYRSAEYADITRLVAGPEGFVAMSWSDGAGLRDISSPDGAAWQAGPATNTWDQVKAYGPAGWLMVGPVDDGRGNTELYLWQSQDGSSWEPLGSLPHTSGYGVMALAGSEAGYVLGSGYGGSSPIFYSADGLVWTQRPSLLGANFGSRIAATPLGFYAWRAEEPSIASEGAFSADGWTWSESNPGGEGQLLDVVADGDHLLGLIRGPVAPRLVVGDIEGETLTWSATAGPFSDRDAVTRLVSDGSRAVVLGWNRHSQVPLWWESRGDAWVRHEMPDAFGGLPHEVAGGLKGIVAVGMRHAGARPMPTVWRLAGQTWLPEPDPLIRPAAQLDRTRCGSPPRDVVDLMTIDGAFAADCFGDRPITVRAFTAECDGCYGEQAGRYRTGWLVAPNDAGVVHLSPVASTNWGSADAVLDPSVLRGLPEAGLWIEVTGHYDDAAASSCRWWPTPFDEDWFQGRDDVVLRCRSWFVVTDWRPVAGPPG